MIAFFSAGALLGLSAGLSPGPLFALVLSQTLRYGIREGCKVAAAPLISDLPVIVVATLLMSRLTNFTPLLGAVSLLGACYLVQMAYETFRCGLKEKTFEGIEPRSLGRGIMVNALSPHPYLFWFSVGAPTILKGASLGKPFASAAFVIGFLGCLVSAKMALALLVGKSRRFLAGRTYQYIMRSLGVLLLVFALMLGREACFLLGLFPA